MFESVRLYLKTEQKYILRTVDLPMVVEGVDATVSEGFVDAVSGVGTALIEELAREEITSDDVEELNAEEEDPKALETIVLLPMAVGVAWLLNAVSEDSNIQLLMKASLAEEPLRVDVLIDSEHETAARSVGRPLDGIICLL